MCYSTSLRKSREAIERRLLGKRPASFQIPLAYRPYYHLNGFTHGNVYMIKMDEQDSIYPAIWGLVPEWHHQDPESFLKQSNTLNARSETIFEKASFQQSASDKRCLILADGFFEPHHENGVAIPYFCYQPSKTYPEGDLFLFAGLYTELDDDLYSATIITTEANAFFSEVHNKKKRMPLVLAEDLIDDWLDDGLNPQTINELMAHGFTSNAFKAHPVSRDVYKKGIDTNQPYIVEPVEPQTLF
ncbi:putative SOS response-associated peptidase YedK [Flavobacteriaceae bacterium MAR_2010_105]|nr:putative SOS response-associated peptidase YedK [Flavobacteriaceae bacterium MAR_2010_105]